MNQPASTPYKSGTTRLQPQTGRPRERAVTRVEVLVILGSLALLAMVATPLLGNTALRSQRAVCVNNLRQIAVGFRAYAMNNQGKYPWIIKPTNTHGQSFRDAGAELVSPRIAKCPGDSRSEMAPAFSNLNSAIHVSYFLNVQAQEHQSANWLAGDRDIHAPGAPLTSGAGLLFSANHGVEGNIGLVDGRVLQLTSAALPAAANAVLSNGYSIYVREP